MSKREWLAKEAMVEPDSIIEKVVEFLLFLKSHPEDWNYEALMLSYPALAKDWFSPDEEEAWKDYQ